MEYSFKDFVAGKIIVTVEKPDMSAFKCKVDAAGIQVPENLFKHIDRFYVRYNSLVGDFCPGGDMPRIPFRSLSDFYTPSDFFAGRVTCKCDTREEYDALMRECEKAGIKWRGGEPIIDPNSERFKPGYTYTLGDTHGKGMLIKCTDLNRRPAKCAGCRSDDCGHKVNVPFSALFPSIRKPATVAPAPYDGRGKHKVGDLFEVIGESTFEIGDIIRLSEDDGSSNPWFVRVSDGLKNAKSWKLLKPYSAPAPKAPEPVKFKVGDIVRGIDPNKYTITNTGMTRGKVVWVRGNSIGIRVLEHTGRYKGDTTFDVDVKDFALVETPAPRAVKVGDTVRFVKKTGMESRSTSAEIGKTYKVEGFSGRGNIRLNVASCPYVNPEDVELVEDKPETPAPAAPKYKVGDRFKVKSKSGAVRFHYDVGDVIRMTRPDLDTDRANFVRDTDGLHQIVLFANLEPVASPSFPRIEITTDGRVTTATMYKDGKPVKTGKATCSPEDEFDFMAGAALAMVRLRYGAHAHPFTNLQARDWAQELTALSAKIKGAIGE